MDDGHTPGSFTYRALDSEGAVRKGVVMAADEAAAVRELMQQGLTALDVRGGARRQSSGSDAAPVVVGRLRTADRSSLVREMSTLLGAGISLAEALPSLAEAYAGQPLGAPLAMIDREVRSGQRISVALGNSGLDLPLYVLALSEAGEASGDLASALADAASQMEHEHRIGQELRNALVYPLVLVVAGVLAVLIIFIGVVPRFASLLRSSRAEVPAISRVIIETGLFVQQNLWPFAAGTVGLCLLGTAVLSRPGARAALLDAISSAPVVGPWLVRMELGRWSTVLGRLLANRVPIIQALNLGASALRLRRLREDLSSAPREIERGRNLSDVLAGLEWFPPARLNLVRVGERSGELPRMLATLGAMETESARTLQKRVLSLIEPAAILIIGAVIGGIMVAVMLAITSLNTVAL